MDSGTVLEDQRSLGSRAAEESGNSMQDCVGMVNRRVESLKDCRFQGVEWRQLTTEEIKKLIGFGNRYDGHASKDWEGIFVTLKAKVDLELIRNCTFKPPVHIGGLERSASTNLNAYGLSAGLYSSTIAECWISDNVRISNCELIQNTYIGANSSILRCGIVTRKPINTSGTCFGNGISIPIVVETQERALRVWAELPLSLACQVAVKSKNSKILSHHETCLEKALKVIQCDWNIVCEGVLLESTNMVQDAYLGPFAVVSGVNRIQRSTILSSLDEPTKVLSGSDACDALLQKNVIVDGQSSIISSLMYKSSRVERHGKLLNSLLGPFSNVANGEVSCSLLGPLVGLHHQSLLIASYWPAGRGNIAYGANVGSNHTGKAPDQEIWHGEGVFFGLGCCIKFPSNFIESPYTLIASGLTTLPQRLSCPFSLLCSSEEILVGRNPAYNSLHPGWVLSDNIYSVLRKEYKFSDICDENVYDGHKVDARIFRADIVRQICLARNALVKIYDPKDEARIYTDLDFVGLGKNMVSGRSMKKAIDTYTYYMFYYAVLYGFWPRLKTKGWNESVVKESIKAILGASSTYDGMENDIDFASNGTYLLVDEELYFRREMMLQNMIIKAECGSFIQHPIGESEDGYILFACGLLRWAKEAKRRIALSALECKQKDEKRGSVIIPDYLDAHGCVSTDDKVIRRAFAEASQLEEEINTSLHILTSR